MLKKIQIKNFNSIKDSGQINFTDSIFVLAGQNESGKSSILDALNAYEKESFDVDTLNFEEQQAGNLTQTVSCTYQVINVEEFHSEIIEALRDEFAIPVDADFIDAKRLHQIKEYEITKSYNHDDDTIEISLNTPVMAIIKACIKKKPVAEEGTSDEPFIDADENLDKISNILFNNSPSIVLFNAFSDLLPDKITIAELEAKDTKAKGYNAVRNLEKLLNKNFVSIAKLQRSHMSSTTQQEVTNLSSRFKKAWKQRIYDDGDLNIRFEIDNEDVSGTAVQTIFFTVETKGNVLLEPRKRSKGMIWFLSAWLDLKARENGHNLVILYDEPGLYLHVKAHSDILALFKELVEKGHQVIYSTHSPSLINTSTLHNIGLVLNTIDGGTVVEGLTTSLINTEYKQDALQPVAEAMGLEPLKDFSILSHKNVLVEGLSDFWYLQSMRQILARTNDYKFVPGIGIKGDKVKPLISFCIGYGLEWLLVMDNGPVPQAAKRILIKDLFEGDKAAAEEKIFLANASEIENLFTVDDLVLIDPTISAADSRTPAEIIGSRKIIFAKQFTKGVEDGVINDLNLSQTAKDNFAVLFDWIDSKFAI